MYTNPKLVVSHKMLKKEENNKMKNKKDSHQTRSLTLDPFGPFAHCSMATGAIYLNLF